MTTVEQIRCAIVDAVRAAGVTVVDAVIGVAAPEDQYGTVLVAIDGAEVTTVRALVDAMHPQVALTAPGDESGFTLHLVGSVWLVVSLITQEELGEMEQRHAGRDDEQGDGEVDAELWAAVDEAIAHLAETVSIGDHRTVHVTRALITEHLAERHPELAEQFRTYRGDSAVWEAANRLQTALKDTHAAAMRRDARTWAEQVYEANPVAGNASRASLRDAAWRHMKRIDEVCATKVATEPVALALEDVAREHTPRFDLPQHPGI